MVRSLLVTPWFVAGAGILIAATLVLESPRSAVLSYGPPNSGVQCATPDCAPIAPGHSHDSLAVVKPGTRLNPARAKNPARTKNAGAVATALPHSSALPVPTAVTVRFRIITYGQGGFIGVITVRGQARLSDWSLGFVIPGASIRGVWGAKWQADARGDGGVAEQAPGQLPGRPQQQQQSESGGPLSSRTGAKVARILVFGSGLPGKPAACTFDGRSCVFS
jgi:hypothetical protein